MTKLTFLGQLSNVDIRQLRVFRAVTEAGGISAAELELNIGRSTISTHIKDLEIRLGVILCQRGRGGFTLTEEGHCVYKATMKLLNSLNEFRSEVNGIHNSLTGQINLSIFEKTASNPKSKIYKAFKQFDELAPEADITIYVESLNEVERGVMEGHLNVGIVPSHRMSPSLNYFPLFNEKMYLYCGKNHHLFSINDKQIQKQDVRACKYAGLGYHSPNMEISHQLNLKRKVTVYSQEAITHLILSGCYIGFLPSNSAEIFVKRGLIRAIAIDIFYYECDLFAIVRRSPKPSRLVQAFLDCLIQAHQ